MRFDIYLFVFLLCSFPEESLNLIPPEEFYEKMKKESSAPNSLDNGDAFHFVYDAIKDEKKKRKRFNYFFIYF